ncbi:MAG: hypothetical protein MI674_05925, partial [Cytophagales bacterium]|nr:hypothetical protein [Cytophagales bacterium]
KRTYPRKEELLNYENKSGLTLPKRTEIYNEWPAMNPFYLYILKLPKLLFELLYVERYIYIYIIECQVRLVWKSGVTLTMEGLYFSG